MKNILIISSLIVVAFLAGNTTSSKSGKDNTPQVQGVTQQISSLPPLQFNELLQTNKYLLLDIRTADEYAAGHLENAKQIDYYQTQAFSDYLDRLDKNAKYLIYCRTGKRSSVASQIMQSKGFEDVTELLGGYNAWVTVGLSISR